MTNKEIYSLVAEYLNLTEEEKQKKYEKTGICVYKSQVGWSLLFLKEPGLISHVDRGEWAITPLGKSKPFLDDEFRREQEEYWKLKLSKNREGANTVPSLEQKGLSSKNLSEDKKEMLKEIIAQNNRILDYLLR